jgi:hypothetical protein
MGANAMTKEQAQVACISINGLNGPFVADVDDVNTTTYAVKVRHQATGNEVGYAKEHSEIQYMIRLMTDRGKYADFKNYKR